MTSLPIDSTIAFNLEPTSKVDLKAESERLFQEAVDAAVVKALLAREQGSLDYRPTTTDSRPPTTDDRLPTTDNRPPTAEADEPRTIE